MSERGEEDERVGSVEVSYEEAYGCSENGRGDVREVELWGVSWEVTTSVSAYYRRLHPRHGLVGELDTEYFVCVERRDDPVVLP